MQQFSSESTLSVNNMSHIPVLSKYGKFDLNRMLATKHRPNEQKVSTVLFSLPQQEMESTENIQVSWTQKWKHRKTNTSSTQHKQIQSTVYVIQKAGGVTYIKPRKQLQQQSYWIWLGRLGTFRCLADFLPNSVGEAFDMRWAGDGWSVRWSEVGWGQTGPVVLGQVDRDQLLFGQNDQKLGFLPVFANK